MFKKSLSLILISSLASAPALQAADTSLYQTIKSEYLPGISLQQPEQKPAVDGKPAPVDLKIRNLTHEERQLLAFNLLAHQDTTKDKGFIQRNTWEDLELFKSSNLLKTIKRTRTSFGEAILGSMLINGASTNPEKNQAVVRTLVENPQLFDQIDAALKEFADAEKVFLSYYLPSDPAKENYFKDLYFKNPISSRLFGNENTAALNFFNHLEGAAQASKVATGIDMRLALIVAGFEGFAAHTAQRILVAKAIDANDAPKFKQELAKAMQKLFGGKSSFASTIAQAVFFGSMPAATVAWLAHRAVASEQAAPFPHMFNMMEQNLFGGKLPAWVIGAGIGLYLTSWYQVGSEGKTALTKQAESMHYLQANLISCASAIDAVTKLEALASQNPQLAQAIPELQTASQLARNTDKLSKLITLLGTKTFKGKASYFSNQGRVLVAHQLMSEHCKSLRAAFEAVGKVDAFMSAAKLFKDHQSLPVKYCFVTFRSKDHGPYLKLNNFWNPVLEVSAAVPNTVEFGAPGKHRNMILTGLNSAGKSTVIKGIVISVLLAQIFGIAAAETAEMTPFTVINTHIMIKDDVEHHRSLFQVEVDQAKDMLERVRSLDSSEFALVIIDEMFRSTGPDHAQVHSYNFAKALSEFSNVITLESTHYKKLVGLEQETKGLFKNFKIEIIQRPDGTLYRPYKIEEGFTTSEITAAIFAEQGLHF
jgi:hypothetical protein